MKERPILFSAPMVRALLAGTKTQTRRIVKPQPADARIGGAASYDEFDNWVWLDGNDGSIVSRLGRCRQGGPGDRLWVRETFCDDWMMTDGVKYRADGGMPADMFDAGCTWRPSIHMRRSVSRITLEITEVRVERLQSISEADAIAEGITHRTMNDPRVEYRWLWESIHGADSWEANPWVWCLSFKRIDQASLTCEPETSEPSAWR